MVKGLLVMDVDSTLIREEGIDLLGKAAGVGEQVARITELAMNGELDFEEALKERVALLKGLPETIFDDVAKSIHFTKGAKELVKTLHDRGFKVGLVSGGFHQTVDRLAKELEIDYVKANTIEVSNGKLTGKVIGDIVTRETKKEKLIEWSNANQVTLQNTVAVGDGANDLLMIRTAGVGIAFCAKPIVTKEAPFSISKPDLLKVLDFINF